MGFLHFPMMPTILYHIPLPHWQAAIESAKYGSLTCQAGLCAAGPAATLVNLSPTKGMERQPLNKMVSPQILQAQMQFVELYRWRSMLSWDPIWPIQINSISSNQFDHQKQSKTVAWFKTVAYSHACLLELSSSWLEWLGSLGCRWRQQNWQQHCHNVLLGDHAPPSWRPISHPLSPGPISHPLSPGPVW